MALALRRGRGGLKARLAPYAPFAIIGFIALLLRVLLVHELGSSPWGHHLLWDEQIYDLWAKKLLVDKSFPPGPYEFPAFPAYAFAAVYTVFGTEANAVRALNVVLGVVAVLLVARAWPERRARLATAAIAALYGPLILYSAVPLKTALLAAFFAWAIAVIARRPAFTAGHAASLSTDAVSSRSLARAAPLARVAALGLACGLTVAVQAQVIIAAAACVVVVALDAWRAPRVKVPRGVRALVAAATFTVAFVVPLAPSAWHGRDSGHFTLLPSQSGFALWLGYGADTEGAYYEPVPFASSSPRTQSADFTLEARRRAGKNLDPIEASAWWRTATVQHCLDKTGACVSRFFAKVAASVNSNEQCDHYDIDTMASTVPIFAFPLPGFAVLLALACCGAVASRSAPDERRAARVLVVVAAAVLLGLAAAFPNGRYRIALVVPLLPLAGRGTVAWWDALSAMASTPAPQTQRRASVVALLVALVVGAGVAHIPVEGAGDRSAYENTEAYLLVNDHDREHAREHWRRAADSGGRYAPFALLALASDAAATGDKAAARAYLARVDDASFVGVDKLTGLARLDLDAGDHDRAIAELRRAHAIMPWHAASEHLLANELRARGSAEADDIAREGIAFQRDFAELAPLAR